MDKKLLNFIYVLIMGRCSAHSVKWTTFNNIWDDEGAVKFFYDHFIDGYTETFIGKVNK